MVSFCSNLEVLNEFGLNQPQSWNDLLNPDLVGLVAMSHPSLTGVGYSSVLTNILRTGELDATFDYLSNLNQNIFLYGKTDSDPSVMAGTGIVAIGITNSSTCLQLQAQGFEGIVGISFPQEGTIDIIYGVALLQNAPNPQGGQAWVDWSLTAQAQEILEGLNIFQIPTNPQANTPASAIRPNQVRLLQNDSTEASKIYQEVIERFIDEIADAP